jgi:hypothetical protein
MTVPRCLARAFLTLLFSVVLGAQNLPTFIDFTIMLNGEKQASPCTVTLTFEGRSVKIIVRNGRLEIPAEVLVKDKITFSATVGGDQIRISDIPGAKFENEKWTLVLEDHRFPVEFQPMPEGAKVRSSCAVVFESKSNEGTVLLDPHCRSKISQVRTR